MKASEIKEILRDALESFESIPDEFDLRLEPNTYFLGNCESFLGISGFDGGYISLDHDDLEEYQRNYGEEVYLDDYVDRFVDWHENSSPNSRNKLDEVYAILDKTGEEDIYDAYLALDEEDQRRCLEIAGINVN